MKSFMTFALTCVSALALLSACGGGGGGGTASIAPLPAPGDRFNLPANVYSGSGGATQINRGALVGYYSNLNSGGGVTDSGRDLLMSGSNDGTAGFRTIRNSANYLSSPSFVTYTISAGATVASVESVRAFGSLLATSDVLMVDGSPVTVGLSGNQLRLGDISITVSNGFRVRAFSSSLSAVRASQAGGTPPGVLQTGGSLLGINRYTYFLDGQYAALCLGFDALNPIVYTWGTSLLTGNVPASGNLTYTIPYAIGAYTNGSNDNRLLNASGTLSANLGSRMVTLNLDVVDHNGSIFLAVDDLGMSLESSINIFRCSGAACSGTIDYADGVSLPDSMAGFDSEGYFYGPNAEEVVGLISHTNGSADMELGFIGRDNTQPVVIPSTPAPVLGAVSPLPAGAYTVIGGDTQINTDELVGYYSGSYDAGNKASDANREFLLFSADSTKTYDNGNEDGYIILRNPVSGFLAGYAAPPAVVVYAVPTGQTAAFFQRVFTLGPQLQIGQQAVLTLGTSLLTLVPGPGNLTVGGREFIDLDANGGDYIGSAHSTSTDLPDNYSFFMRAEYAALYADLDGSPTRTDDGSGNVEYDLVGSFWSWGALTDYGDIPTAGTVTYRIDHVVGAYTDSQNYANSRLLSGNGSLVADFAAGSRMVTLNLDVFDHRGSMFLDVTNLGMSIDADRNEFHCSYSPIPNPSPTCAGGSIDYADGVNLQDITGPSDIPSSDSFNARGSFYGPNAEEVAGGMSQSTSGADLELGFIGKKP